MAEQEKEAPKAENENKEELSPEELEKAAGGLLTSYSYGGTTLGGTTIGGTPTVTAPTLSGPGSLLL